MAGLQFRYNRFGLLPGPAESFVINNSATLTLGDVVAVTDDYVALAGAGNPVYGVVQGFETVKKQALENSVSGEDYDGTYTAGGLGVGTYVAAADNLTDKKVRAIVRPFVPGDVWRVLANADLATTGNSENAGGYFDLAAASDILDESSFATSSCQFYSYGQDPILGGRYVLVSAYEVEA